MSNVVISSHTGRLTLYINERVENRLQMRVTDLVVKVVGESLQIDIGRIHVSIELGARLRTDIAGGDRNILDAQRAAGDRRVDRIFVKDCGIVVGVGDARTFEPLRGARNIFRAGALCKHVKFARLADVPILAKFTPEVAAARSERQRRSSRQEMIESLLLYGIDAKAARTAIGRQHDLIALPGANEAEGALTLVKLAKAGTQVALDAAILELTPVFGGVSVE